MELLISNISALEYWRSSEANVLGNSRERARATRSAQAALRRGEKPLLPSDQELPSGCAEPVHLLIGDPAVRTSTTRITTHLHRSPLPHTSFMQINNQFLVSTPELCFFQMTSNLSRAQLIALGCELCGTYAHHPNDPASNRDQPLTSTVRLRAFAEHAAGLRGSRPAAKALPHIHDGSASPMETAFVLMLCLPYRLGGYGIPRPELNYRIDIPPSLRKLADRRYCVCDACWPEANITCEYDSDRYHLDRERRERDERRRNVLTALGYTVITVTRGQIADPGAFNRLARQIAQLLGKQLKYRDPQFTRAHRALRADLFGNPVGR